MTSSTRSLSSRSGPDHPLGLPILGTRETVEALDREQLLRFFRETYTPSNLIVSAAGNLDHQKVVDLVDIHFRPLQQSPNGVHESPPSVDPAMRFREKNLEQVHLVLGTVAPHQSHEDRYTSYVLNTILGGTMSSRLFQGDPRKARARLQRRLRSQLLPGRRQSHDLRRHQSSKLCPSRGASPRGAPPDPARAGW